VTPSALAELQGLQALARSLVHGDAEADDLLQDAALTALEHPPPDDRPLRGWFAVVIRNRWRMNRRAESRRRIREDVSSALAVDREDPVDSIDRARALQRLSEALVALPSELREVVMRRYLDGLTAAQIARDLDIPAGTVRWRLKTALERLRAALDTSDKRTSWMRALAPLPLKGVAFVKAKTKVSIVLALVGLLLLGGGLWFAFRRNTPSSPTTAATAPPTSPTQPARGTPAAPAPAAAPAAPNPGQGRATIETLPPSTAGVVSGRVINWSSGDGVADADLTFTADDGAYTVRSGRDGAFELAPGHPVELLLTTITARGFLPFAPEYLHSSIRVQVRPGHAVRGLTVFMFPALDYHGRVVASGAAVPNAHVRLLAAPSGEQRLDHPATEWTTDADGRFTFHAADDAILEATAGDLRGWSRLDGNVAISKELVIELFAAPARDATITGHLVDESGHGIADALVRADPEGTDDPHAPRATAFDVTAADGAFEIRDLDRGAYVLEAEAEDRAPARKRGITGGTHGVSLVAQAGALLSGTVTTTAGDPVPAFTLLVFEREGAARHVAVERSIVDAGGRFEVRVQPGSYELSASAAGWAPTARTAARAPAKDISLVVSEGATLSGTVVSSADHLPISYARVMVEGRGGGASAQPANAGTVTREDGTFVLTGIAPGPLSLTIVADHFNPKIEAGLSASDGAKLGPLTFQLTPLAPGETPKLDLVGIGVQLKADGDALLVMQVMPGGGAAEVGIAQGEHIVAVEGAAVAEIGLDGAIERIRGQPDTTVAISLTRGDKVVTLAVPRRKLHV
jgi:RNA polymerase sigma factor (sigma-70 family)